MDLGLQGKVAIVTGSSDGIGYATALALAREGTRTVICGRREPLLAEARDRIARETGSELLARIIHGFLRSCEKLASIVKRLQFEYPMLKFMQDVASLVMVRPKKPIFRKHPYVSLL